MSATRLIVTATALLVTPSIVHAQWVKFVNETTTRMPVGPGLNTAALSTTDPEEKDYAWGDIDKDGDIDLVCVRKQPFTSAGRKPNVLFMNEGIAEGHSVNGVLVDRTAQYASASTVAGDQGFLTPTNDRDVVLADVNNDTWLDIITAPTLSEGQPTHIAFPRIYINLGEINGVWQGFRYEHTRIPNFAPASAPTAVPRFCSVAAGDVTGDGFADLYFGDYDSGPFESHDFNNKLLINQGKANPGVFIDSGTTRMSANPGLLSAFGAASIIADINNDGANDVIKQTSLNSPLHVAVQHNNPQNIGFFPDTVYKVIDNAAPYFVSAGDLNNDGRLDLIISDDGQDHYWINTGNAPNGTVNFTRIDFAYQPGNGDDGFSSNSLAADLNNDGWADVLVADVDVDISGCSRRMHIYRNLGNAPNVTLQEQNPAVIPTSNLTGVHDVAALDLNNDGWLDLVVGRCTGTQVYMNIPPAGVQFAYPQGLPAYITPDQPHTFQVQLSAIGGGTVQANSGKIYISTAGGPFVETNMTSLGGNLYQATLASTPCPQTIRFYVSGRLSDNSQFFDPPQAASAPYVAVAAVGTEVTTDDTIEGSVASWTIVNDPTLTGGAWEAATPNGTINAGLIAAPFEDATGGEGVRCFVTENGPSTSTNPSNWDVDGGPTQLLSPTLDLAGTDATISFSTWFYTSGPATGDAMTVAVSNNNGGSWTNVMTINSTNDGANTAWLVKSFVVSDFVAPTASVRVRFSAADIGAASVVEAGIDNFRVNEVVCTKTQPCPADVTADTVVNVADLLAVIQSWGPCIGCAADINDDAVVNVSDLLAVIQAWGNCP